MHASHRANADDAEIRIALDFPHPDQSALVISLLLEFLALMDVNVAQPCIWQASDTIYDIEGLKKSQLRAKPCTNAETQLLVLRLLSKLWQNK